MGMRTALDVLNRMLKAGVITRYALAGAVAAYNYIEPTVTTTSTSSSRWTRRADERA